LHVFDAFGVELEYMLVRQDTLDVLPAVDELLKAATGRYASDFEDGPITWSNELVRHVVEVKVTAPVATLSGLPQDFMRSLGKMADMADVFSARLLPTAMHPWMDPATETHLWPHEYAEVYQTFHRVFNCHRHGWANLQSVHLNLPFCGDDEFARLHAAIRLVLPLIPALAAASPVADGRITGIMDNRLDVYCRNSRIIPHITGEIIPEPVYSRAAYHDEIFQPMFAAIAPHDPEGILQDEFLNARGAIARFERSAIEIRLIDVQECPVADIAIVQAVIHAVRSLVEEKTCAWREQARWSASRLRRLLDATIREAEATVLDDPEFLAAWGITQKAPVTAQDVWRHILRDITPDGPDIGIALENILSDGPLARRMLRHVPAQPSRQDLTALYHKLADGLRRGAMLDYGKRIGCT
jgi:hypothetical protein